ncbi:MAG: hypothetical protein ACXVZL_11045 [Gaiellaceae bacterium]
MSAPIQPELDAEQEVDFRRYRGLLAARWWLIAAGLVAGAIIGFVLALGGGSVWKAEALISLGQPYTPGFGSPVTSYGTNPRAVSEIVRSDSALKDAAHAAGMHVGALRGHVSTGQVGTATGTGGARAVGLISLTVQGAKPAKVERAASRLAHTVVERTTAPYVGQKIATLNAKLASLQKRIDTQTQTVTLLQQQSNNKSLSPLDRLALISQLNGAEQLLGTLMDEQANSQQQLAFSRNVESATIVEQASAVKSTARSRRTSILVGGLIGLILGALAAILWEPLTSRSTRA